MIVSLQITEDETERSYYITQKDGGLWLKNDEEEGTVIAETQLFNILDDYFQLEF